ncbi:MAG: F0F1 ATP synthase subunit epsilon [Cytophagia bacterium]|nr:F0F1 ATP synthase subunit epsilon [Cytophagia bacterium]
MALELKVLTPEKTVFEGSVVSVKVPGNDGPFEVLRDHAPIIASLQNPGTLEVKNDQGQPIRFRLLGGVVEVLQNKVIVLSPGLGEDS